MSFKTTDVKFSAVFSLGLSVLHSVRQCTAMDTTCQYHTVYCQGHHLSVSHNVLPWTPPVSITQCTAMDTTCQYRTVYCQGHHLSVSHNVLPWTPPVSITQCTAMDTTCQYHTVYCHGHHLSVSHIVLPRTPPREPSMNIKTQIPLPLPSR
jgi:hypothetical protein